MDDQLLQQKRFHQDPIENSSRPAKKLKTGTIPIHRGKFKNRWLVKHASLLKRPDDVSGLLITSLAGAETRAIGQAREFLQKFLIQLFPVHNSTWTRFEGELDVDDKYLSNKDSIQEGKEEEEDIDEVKKDTKKIIADEKKNKKFLAVDTAAGGTIFYRFRIDVSPIQFMTRVIEHIQTFSEDERLALSKSLSHCSRFIPLTNFCLASAENIHKTVAKAIEASFGTSSPSKADVSTSPTIAIVIEKRNNESLNRDAMIRDLAGLIPEWFKINLTNPKYVIMVNIFKSVCGVGVLENYYEWKKYNLQTLLAPMVKKDELKNVVKTLE